MVQSQPWATNSWDPISKRPTTKKRAGEMAQDIGPEFKPQYHKKEEEKEEEAAYTK
jgi:hypothetical protein